VRGVARERIGNAHSLHSVARPSIEPTEGVPGLERRRAKPTAVRAALGSAGSDPAVERQTGYAANAGDGALAVAPPGDKEDVRGFAVPVRLPQPKGAGGQAANVSDGPRPMRKRLTHLTCCAGRAEPKLPR
jgi:hypothetical protein